MTVPQGTFTFPGITGVLNASVTFNLGINPSVTSVTLPPSILPSRIGTAVWSYNGVVRSLPNSVVDNWQITRSGGTTVLNVAILDRRWQWAFGQISGEYNRASSTETNGVVPATEKNPRELATLCLDAMGETGYDVSALPENDRPFVEWELEVPAKALAEICDLYGCAVSLQLNNKVRIVRLGEGNPLPPGFISNDDSFTLVSVPNRLVAASAPVRYQVDLETEAVGLDTDGTIKLIADLSYEPAGGWALYDFRKFTATAIADEESRKLANATVYRWFRVKTPTLNPDADLPADPTDIAEILPLIDRLGTRLQNADDEDFEEAVVWGKFNSNGGGGSPNTDDVITVADYSPDLINQLNFTLDADLGILKYSEPQILLDSDPNARTGPLPAQLYYRCCVQVRTTEDRSFYRRTRTVTVDPTSPAPDRYLLRDDLIPIYTGGAGAWTNNLTELDEKFDFYLSQEIANYRSIAGSDAEYAGFLSVNTDGALRQVSYSIGADGSASTRVGFNLERQDRGVTYKEARRAQQLTQSIEKQRRDGRRRNRNKHKEGGS